MASRIEYRPLKQELDFEGSLDGQSNYRQQAVNYHHPRVLHGGITYLLGLLLVVSFATNIYQYHRTTDAEPAKYNYAGLSRTKAVVVGHDMRSLDDEVWTDKRHNSFTGMVALDDDYVEKHGLLPAQRYPWDKSKSLYALRGFHSWHCVQSLRKLVMDVRDGREVRAPISHYTHCLHQLREDIECHADDFPMYTGRYNAEVNHTVTFAGTGETRMCRDWDQLLKFAYQNTACWNQTRSIVQGLPLIEDYKDCPDGSEPWKKMAEEN